MTDTVKQGPRIVEDFEVLGLLQKVAQPILAQDPNYVYEGPNGSCVNLEDDGKGNLAGSCLVGRVFLELGLEPNLDWQHGSFRTVRDENTEGRFKFTPEAEWILGTAQNLQDGKMPWARVLQAVDVGLSNLYYHRRAYESPTSSEA